jgi:phosphate transport system protein
MDNKELLKNTKIEVRLIEAKKSIISFFKLIEEQFLDLQTLITQPPNKEENIRIYNNDKIINACALHATNQIIFSIAQTQAFASDLRTFVSYLHIIKDGERIGDYAKRFASFLLNNAFPENLLVEHKICLDLGIKMLKGVLEAIDKNNIEIAITTSRYDKTLNEEFHNATKSIIKSLQNTVNYKEVSDYLARMQLLKYLERMGDHLINICEAVIYINTGEFCNLNQQKNKPENNERE